MEDKTKLKEYIAKRKKTASLKPVEVKTVKQAWYQRPLQEDEFIVKKGKDNKFYIRHDEWSETIFIGPYKDTYDVNEIIKSYVKASLEMSLDKKLDSRVHSISIDNPKEFFNG
jgi:hypothetical protein